MCAVPLCMDDEYSYKVKEWLVNKNVEIQVLSPVNITIEIKN